MHRKRSRFTVPPRQQVGFTYLWVLMLVALMGMALTVAAEMDSMVSRRDREKHLLAVGRQFQIAIAHYYERMLVNGRNEYPRSLEDLLKDPRYPGTMRHLRRIFVDPMTGKTEWGLVRLGDRIVGVHSLSEQKPVKQDNFEVEAAHFAGSESYTQWVFTYPPNLLLKVNNQSDNTAGTPAKPQSTAPDNAGAWRPR
ncbi:MAG: type II secretion system protein [Betaproteobacteria bacterium]|nr:type II secretion system protein [Betaproteobacteria bacterium]